MLSSVVAPQQPLSIAQPFAVRGYHNDAEFLGAVYNFSIRSVFITGILGAVYWRRNLITMLLCSEIAFIACSVNFLYASAYLNDMAGMLFSITITTISACETALGLALCVGYFQSRAANEVEALNLLK
uniref:ND4L n=1 Tax=Polytomella sp. Pringsheim 198.80 TaxID=37502 RepID=UPI001E1E2412|nr:Chain K, ND4L [Polytomella sp. Pringsheim 198.80]7ARD_K Chain K, ND4L [Polytomella sp. Pringsheim 198.80]